MIKLIQMCDLPIDVAAKLFYYLNDTKIRLICYGEDISHIITDVHPEELVYPEGWYYNKGSFMKQNLHVKLNSIRIEIPMLKSDGTLWN